jgi:2-polyprenyl-3-methyl-5-hydroxy-6-metoxy-1,4-benzoquinol methylase
VTAGVQNQDDEWSTIFEQRGYLRLDEAKLRAWITANRAFFAALTALSGPVASDSGNALLDIGSGPGRHACGAAYLGYRVLGIDMDPAMIAAATANARAVVPAADISFQLMDAGEAARALGRRGFEVVTHGGLLEHLPSAADMTAELRRHLTLAPNVVFDVPVRTPRNEALFAADSVFRHVWDADQWLATVLAGFTIVSSEVETRTDPGMTDDLVVWLRE